ncbi:MAG: 5-formyltetrahydrofolate cyclo-ligase [Candidatus Binatus sp.]|uniref:5-formyltetrahydrofolate cyclo-ligase n=1 Tax=Candidatus Binatus sp. TaxID=2811406 RepID=UPI003BB20750
MATTVADEKKNLRAIMIACRNAVSSERARASSQTVQRNLIASEYYREASAIVLYAGIGNEVSTDLILADALKSDRAVFYPRVDVGMIVARRVRDRAALVAGAYGILEPPASAEVLDRKSFAKVLVCVPGVAFGLEGQRLGRGGGHYDRFIAQLGDEAITVGLAFSFQLLDRIPETGFDRRLNFIVTESEVHRACEAPLLARRTRTKEVNPGGSNHGNPGIHNWWRGLIHLGNNETA